MKMAEMFASNYLSKDDVETDTTLIIDRLEMKTLEFDGKKENKPVLYWTDDETKPMVLNKSNAEVLVDALGDESDNWFGHEVTVYVDPNVQYMGKKVGGLRIKVSAKQAPAKKK